MNADETRSKVRRPRPIKPRDLAPGPARDLRDRLSELHERGGRPSLDQLAEWIERKDDLPGCPRRDMIGRIISGAQRPRDVHDASAVAAALAHFAEQPVEAAQREARELWESAVAASAAIPKTAAPAGTDPNRIGRPVRTCSASSLE